MKDGKKTRSRKKLSNPMFTHAEAINTSDDVAKTIGFSDAELSTVDYQ